jgi:hypothetical protein
MVGKGRRRGHQFASPSKAMMLGTNNVRTRKVSTSTLRARTKPIWFSDSDELNSIPEKATASTNPATVMTGPAVTSAGGEK